MLEFSLSAIGADRPGIVAAITGVLAELGCSIEDSEMAVLRGNFAVMLVLSAPETLEPTQVEAALAPVATRFELVVAVRPLTVPAPADASARAGSPPSPGFAGNDTAGAGETWSISVHGADRPGIVATISGTLAEAGANIVALRTHVAGDSANPLYVMVMEAGIPGGTDLAALGNQLEAVSRELGVSVTVTPVEGEIL